MRDEMNALVSSERLAVKAFLSGFMYAAVGNTLDGAINDLAGRFGVTKDDVREVWGEVKGKILEV